MSRAFYESPLSATAYEQWAWGYRAAERYYPWVYDPSFALGTDEDVYEKVRRDAVTAQAMLFRRHMVAGRDVSVEAASDNEDARLAASIVQDILEQVELFGESRFHLSDGIFRGSSAAWVQGEWRELELGGLPRARWWVPTRLLDLDRRNFRKVWVPEGTDTVEVETPRGAETKTAMRGFHEWTVWSNEVGDWLSVKHPEWFVRFTYQDSQDTLGYGRGLLDSIHYYQSAKTRVLQEGVMACERFGQGFLSLGVDRSGPGGAGKTTADLQNEWLDVLEKHRARHILVHGVEDKLQFHNGFGEGWQLIERLLSYFDNAIRVLILGSNLPTSATSGGSFALAQVQENSTEALIQFDRMLLGEVLTRDLVGLIWSCNTAILKDLGLARGRKPRIRIQQEKRDDPLVAASTITQALQAGIPLKREEVYRKLGFTAPNPDDDVVVSPMQAGGGGRPSYASGTRPMDPPGATRPAPPPGPPEQPVGLPKPSKRGIQLDAEALRAGIKKVQTYGATDAELEELAHRCLGVA